jgi:hypothetical protein
LPAVIGSEPALALSPTNRAAGVTPVACDSRSILTRVSPQTCSRRGSPLRLPTPTACPDCLRRCHRARPRPVPLWQPPDVPGNSVRHRWIAVATARSPSAVPPTVCWPVRLRPQSAPVPATAGVRRRSERVSGDDSVSRRPKIFAHTWVATWVATQAPDHVRARPARSVLISKGTLHDLSRPLSLGLKICCPKGVRVRLPPPAPSFPISKSAKTRPLRVQTHRSGLT